MNYQNLSNIELQKFYNSAGFFILNDLPISTQFSIDGHTSITGPRFKGLKLLPPGFHLITYISEPRKKTQESLSQDHISQQIKHGLIRFFKPKEIIIRRYDENEERIQSIQDETISSIEYMKSLDSNLAPYPIERYSIWKSLTCFITIELVEEVFGIDERGDSILDSLMSNEEENLKPYPSHPRDLSASYPRHQHQLFSHQSSTHCPENLSNQKFTNWPKINLKRSWPKDSIGEELSKWSQDKSYLFHQFILHQCQKDLNKFLGYIQLSYLTFLQVHSFQSLETYQTLLNLLTKSSPKELEKFNPNYIPIIISTITQLINQLKELSNDFFIELQDPQLENWFFKTINYFRNHLNQILCNENQELIQLQWKTLQEDCKRFDWNIQDLRIGGHEDESSDEDDDESDEDEDEKPVIVET